MLLPFPGLEFCVLGADVLGMRRLVSAAVAAAALTLSGLLPAGQAVAATTYHVSLRAAVDGLKVASEHRTGYARSKFTHWVDADGDGCDTRSEVLLAEAVTKPKVGSRCTLTGGAWVSYYDRKRWTDRGRIDIDHLVPLAEAWDSGAWRWTASQRTAYANDLGDPRTLVGVTDSVNQSKADRDIAEWRPAYDGCRYVREWTAVKLRWQLTVDSTEKAAMKKLAGSCSNVTLTVTRAI
ncbi:MAG TPA: HNH endonuclease family protein [Mycobacteriales bacterium]